MNDDAQCIIATGITIFLILVGFGLLAFLFGQ